VGVAEAVAEAVTRAVADGDAETFGLADGFGPACGEQAVLSSTAMSSAARTGFTADVTMPEGFRYPITSERPLKQRRRPPWPKPGAGARD
jgi:hypothetical protein